LVSSGLTITWSHYSFISNDVAESKNRLIITIFLGVYFSCLQLFEYINASFTIADSIYGSTFFISTGFHGIHVIVGTTFLVVCLIRLLSMHFSFYHHFGFEAAS
ncbi:Cytochrome c oxidase subunit 3, partial [Trachymyrmex zeteki]